MVRMFTSKKIKRILKMTLKNYAVLFTS